MKRFTAFFIAIILLLSLPACGTVKTDPDLIGTWRSLTYGYVPPEVWTFRADGTCLFSWAGGDLNYRYEAEQGRLFVDAPRNERNDEWYDYKIGVTDDGRDCLILTGTNRTSYYFK